MIGGKVNRSYKNRFSRQFFKLSEYIIYQILIENLTDI